MKIRYAATAALIVAMVGLTGCGAATESEKGAGSTASSGESGEPRSWDEIQESGVLRVGTITDYPPNEFKTENGTPTGWAVELVDLIAEELGLEAEFEPLLFDNIIPRVKGGAVDLGVGSFTDTLERQKVVDFVNYYEAGTLWAARAGVTVDPENACGLTVAVMSGGTQHLTELPKRNETCLASGKNPIEILPFTGQPEVTNAVVQGQADAFSADSPVTADAVNALDGNIEIVGDMFDSAPYGFPVARGSELAEPVREALQRIIDDGRYLELLTTYHSEAGAIERAAINAGTA